MDYLNGHKASGLRIGDRVRITRKADNAENGWKSYWAPIMDCTVGEIGTIESDDNYYGFKVNVGPGGDWRYPYFILEKVVEDGAVPPPGKPVPVSEMDYGDGNDLVRSLRELYPYGHERFIPMTLDEMQLHSTKNHDYAFGGKATGNFDRVANILDQYPGLNMSRPWNVATVYLLKQLDAALWLECKGHDAKVEGQDARWGDVSVYSKIIRLLIKEGKETSDV